MAFQKGNEIPVGIHFYSDNYNIVVIICDQKREENKRKPFNILTSINNLTRDRF